MEGLIPLFYKTLKKNKTRRKYKCLSSGAAAQSYDISDFYADGGYPTPQPERRSTNYVGGGSGGVHAEGINGRHHHRRHNSSIGDYSSTGFSMQEEDDNRVMKSKQLVRFRSSRFFSCVTGTA